MTDTTDKIRGLFLAALMVLSVFAGTVALAGTAAAATNNETITPANTEAGATTNYTSTADITSLSSAQDMNYLTLDFGGADYSSVGGQSVTVYVNDSNGNNSVQSSSVSTDADGNLSVTLSNSINVDGGDMITIHVPDVQNPAGGTYTGMVSLETTTEGNTFEGYSAQFSISGSTTTVRSAEANVTSNDRRWQGQSLFMKDGDDGGKTYDLYKVVSSGSDTFVSEITLDQYGEAVLNTDNREGEYYIENESGMAVIFDSNGMASGTTSTVSDASFTIAQQSFSASFASDSVRKGESEDITFQSNRGNYMVNVSSSGLSQSELQSVFGGMTMGDNKVAIMVSGTDATMAADFTGISTGNYSFDFTVVDTEESDSDSLDVKSAADTGASFTKSVFRENRGDVAEVTVNLDNTDTATVNLGGSNANYQATAMVKDGNNDGTVTLTINTYTAGNSSRTASTFGTTDSSDSVQMASQTDLQTTRVLDASTYDLNVTVGGSEEDVSALSVTERSTDAMNIWTAPSQEWNQIDDKESIMMLANAGDLTQDNSIAMQDVVLHEVKASGIFGYLQFAIDSDNISASNPTEALAWAATSDDKLSITVMQTNPGPNEEPKVIDLGAAFNNGAVKVVTDEENATHYIALKTNQLSTVSSSRSIKAGDTFNATFTVEAGALAASDQTVFSKFTMKERKLEFATQREMSGEEHIIVGAAENQSITGTSTVASGTSISIQVKATGDSPFLKAQTTNVSDGQFSAMFDFSDVEAGTNFTANTNNFDAQTPGQVVEATMTTTMQQTTMQTTEQTTMQTTEQTTMQTTESTPEPTTTTESTPEPTEETTTTTGGGPGFGVAVSLIALVGAALVALRRRN